jgi:methionyl-tRNA formyltransferase
MMVEPELDSGPILLQRSTAIDATETAPQVMQRLAEMGADLLSETLRDFGKVRAREQDHAQASFAPILKKEDGLIKWSSTATSIDRAIRGFQPWPNAYTAYQSRGLTVFRAEIGSATNEVAAPGQVLAARGDDLIVACGEQSTLRILELQPEARRRMGVRDFLNGVPVKVGDRLG